MSEDARNHKIGGGMNHLNQQQKADITWSKLQIVTGWWLTYPSEKYEFVNGKDYPMYYGK